MLDRTDRRREMLETERLRLRPFTADDGDTLFTLYGDSRVMSIRKNGPQTRPQSDAELTGIVEHWRRRGFGLHAVFDKADGRFLGECGLRERDPGGEEIELSYGLVPDSWGRGLAAEASRAVLAEGFARHSLHRIWAIARASNARSRRVMEKLGFRFLDELPKGDGAIVRYVLERPAG
jgi:RimJ/RimL family protein N-acetyltransferase